MKSDKARELLEEFRSVTTRRGNLLDTVRPLAVREVVNVLLGWPATIVLLMASYLYGT